MVAGVIAVGAALYGAYEGERSASEQRKARRAQERINELQAAKARRDMVREAQKASAAAVAASASTGTMGSSRQMSAVGSIASQVNNDFILTEQALALGAEASQYLANAARYQQYGQIVTTIGNTAARELR